MDDNIKQAEKRGYGKGYAAGKKRKALDNSRDRRARAENAFWQRAFLAVLPTCIGLEGWKFGDKPINSAKDRTALACRFADRALEEAKWKLSA